MRIAGASASERNAATSLVLNREPRTLWRRSSQSLARFRKRRIRSRRKTIRFRLNSAMTTTLEATGMSGSRTPTSTAVATTSTTSTATMMTRLRLRFSRSSGGRMTSGGTREAAGAAPDRAPARRPRIFTGLPSRAGPAVPGLWRPAGSSTHPRSSYPPEGEKGGLFPGRLRPGGDEREDPGDGRVRRARPDLGPHPDVVELVEVQETHLGQLEGPELGQDALGLPHVARDVGLPLLALHGAHPELLRQDVVEDLALHQLGHDPAVHPPGVVLPELELEAHAGGDARSQALDDAVGHGAQEDQGDQQRAVGIGDHQVRDPQRDDGAGRRPRHE